MRMVGWALVGWPVAVALVLIERETALQCHCGVWGWVFLPGFLVGMAAVSFGVFLLTRP